MGTLGIFTAKVGTQVKDVGRAKSIAETGDIITIQ